MAMVLSYTDSINEQMAINEAAAAGLKSMDYLLSEAANSQNQADCREVTDFAVSKFKKAIPVLNRTGHARFRRGPVQSQPKEMPSQLTDVVPSQQPAHQPLSLFPSSDCSSEPAAAAPPHSAQPLLTLDFTKSFESSPKDVEAMGLSLLSTSGNNTTSSSTFLSSITGEGSVSNGKGGGSAPATLFLTAPASGASAGKPPLSGKRCRDHHHSEDVSGRTTNGSGRCHCKKRISRVKRTIRVPAISSKVADIPQDEFSWRKYGQKPIKGSPYPRGYYKCSTVRGCPARKHVERATDEPAMLIVTYEGEHRHTTPENTSQLMVF